MKPSKQILRLQLSKHKSALIDAALALGILVSGAMMYRSCAQLSLQDRSTSKASQTSALQPIEEVTLPTIYFPVTPDTLNTNEKE